MRRLLSATLAAALACAPASSSVLPPPQLAAFTTTTIWLRAAPALDAHRLALLPQGTAVRVDRCASTSCEVQFQTLRGYVPEEVLALEAAGTIEGGLGYFPATSRSKRGLPLSEAKVGSIRSQPGEM